MAHHEAGGGVHAITVINSRMRQTDWRSGEHVWIIDVVAPFGGLDGVLREIKAQVFPDQPLKVLRPGQDGHGVQVVEVGDNLDRRVEAKTGD